MSAEGTSTHNAFREIVRIHSGIFLAQGIVLSLLGVAAMIWPYVSTLAVEVYAGWLFLFSGISGLGVALLAPRGGVAGPLLTGALTLLTGILLLWHPAQGVLALTAVLTAFFTVEGLFQVVVAFGARPVFPESWLWMLLSGLVDLGLAAMIFAGLPGSAGWVLGLVVGVNLLSSGIAIVMMAVTVRQVAKLGDRAAAE